MRALLPLLAALFPCALFVDPSRAASPDVRALARSISDAFNAHDIDKLGSLVHADYVDHGAATDKASYLELARRSFEAFPDLHVTVSDTVAEADKIAVRCEYTGTHSARFLGVDATGKKVAWDGLSILRFQDGLMVERWNQADTLNLLLQLGLVPQPAPAPADAR